MTTLVATAQFDDFYESLDAFRVLSLYQYSKQLESDLSGAFTFKQISTSQIAVASSGDIVMVDGSGLTIPAGSLLNGSDSNLSWSNVGGTLQEVRVYQGGSFQNGAVSGGALLLDAILSPTQYSVTYGGNDLILTGSSFPTDVGSFGQLIHGDYNGANFNLSSVTLESGGKSVSLSLSPTAYTVTSGDYRAVLSGTGLPTSFSPTFLEQLVEGQGPLSIAGSFTGISVTQISTGATVLSESGAAPISLDTLLSGQELFFTALLSNVSSVHASAADVSSALDRLDTLAYHHTLTSISLTDSGTPLLQLTGSQLGDSYALAELAGNYQIEVTGISAFQVGSLPRDHLKSYSIADYAEELQYARGPGDLYGLGSLLPDIQSGALTGITVTDPGGNIEIGASQLSADMPVFNLIKGDYTVTLDAPLGGGAITGLAGHGSIAKMDGFSANFTVTVNSDGSGFTAKSSSGTLAISGVDALQFYDQTDIVAHTPGSASAPTTGNITELYSAVFAREPDIDGLVFYEHFLAANPGTPLQQFAQYFLASSEYTANTAHNYAQSTAGDTQFITDSYKNLLHRSPSPSEVAFYLNNVMAPAEASLTSGTQAFATAQTQAHALMLVYFSASSEFLSDVQITATTPTNYQHWLYLI